MLEMNVRTRMAPSPTGNLHIGTTYATMWPYLFAKHNQGTFILRIEDTDRERSKKEFENNIIEGLKWMGFDWEGPYHQMDRLEGYKKAVEKLLEEGKAYYCFCTKEELDEERKKQVAEKKAQVYSGKCRVLTKEEVEARKNSGAPWVIRHKLPVDRGVVEYEDLIHGKISFDSNLIGDTVIMRQSGIPLYNFAVVVDDIDMKISHVIRGDDHISNTPKQILLFEALDEPVPFFAHNPVILNQDRVGKLSKRSGSTSLDEFRKEGYLPEALFNYIALLGWNTSSDQEIFSKEEIIEKFEIKDINKSAAAWNQEKLDWMNGEYIRKMSDEELTKRLEEFLVDHPAKDKIAPCVPLIKERIKKLSDFIPLTDFLYLKPEYDQEVFKKISEAFLRIKVDDVKNVMAEILKEMENLPKPWEAKKFEETFRGLAEKLGISVSDMFQIIRIGVSGKLVTPPLFESIKILGEEETINRIKSAILFLS